MPSVLERAVHLRRLVIVHSALYYELNESLVTDAKFDGWCRELVALYKSSPEVIEHGEFAPEFVDFDGSTGFHLARLSWGITTAQKLLRQHRAGLFGATPPTQVPTGSTRSQARWSRKVTDPMKNVPPEVAAAFQKSCQEAQLATCVWRSCINCKRFEGGICALYKATPPPEVLVLACPSWENPLPF